ncbi:AAA family ATPase [Lactococcus garvieae]|uniref:AAA family ATPase n=1 Tax=Lactococcus garvieae TaxID=1363 RepID=UPI00254C5D0C|nr:AAA family ATPase [Lactococcus garvieae]
MDYYPLYTYENINELRKMQEENEVLPFFFQEAREILMDNPEVFLDITSLVEFLKVNPSDTYAAYNNLKQMTDATRVVVNKKLVDSALEQFPHLFSSTQPFYAQHAEDTIIESSLERFSNGRKSVYCYENTKDLDVILEYAQRQNIPMTTFSLANGNLRREIEKFNLASEKILVDLTSISYAIEDNKNLIYLVESFLNDFPNIKLLVLRQNSAKLLDYFPLYIKERCDINELFPDLEIDSTGSGSEDNLRKISDLSAKEFEQFNMYFRDNLVGHKNFKDTLTHQLHNFIMLNKFKEQKVFSIFLFGESGIGKTEVARLISQGLQEDSYLAKINFQNYSSQDALNGLIGSPAGYVGYGSGELKEKIEKSNVGVVLLDEFEKTTKPVFSFFLEVLEEGNFTDSKAREYDLDGYILIFTSNIRSEEEYKKKIPPELQTRFDLVCEFSTPTYQEKRDFLELLLKQAKEKYKEQFSTLDMEEATRETIDSINCSESDSLRELKRKFKHRLMDYFRVQGVFSRIKA